MSKTAHFRISSVVKTQESRGMLTVLRVRWLRWLGLDGERMLKRRGSRGSISVPLFLPGRAVFAGGVAEVDGRTRQEKREKEERQGGSRIVPPDLFEFFSPSSCFA